MVLFAGLLLLLFFLMVKTVLLPQLLLNSNTDDSHLHNIRIYPGVVFTVPSPEHIEEQDVYGLES